MEFENRTFSLVIDCAVDIDLEDLINDIKIDKNLVYKSLITKNVSIFEPIELKKKKKKESKGIKNVIFLTYAFPNAKDSSIQIRNNKGFLQIVIISNPWNDDNFYKTLLKHLSVPLSKVKNIEHKSVFTVSILPENKIINVQAFSDYIWPMKNGTIIFNDVRKQAGNLSIISAKKISYTYNTLTSDNSVLRYNFHRIINSNSTSSFKIYMAVMPNSLQLTTSLDTKEITAQKFEFAEEIRIFEEFIKDHISKIQDIFLDKAQDQINYTMNTIKAVAYDKGKILNDTGSLSARIKNKSVNLFDTKTMKWSENEYQIIKKDPNKQFNVIIKKGEKLVSVPVNLLRIIKNIAGNSIKGRNDHFPVPYSFTGSCPNIDEYINPGGHQSYSDNLYYPVCTKMPEKIEKNMMNFIFNGFPEQLKEIYNVETPDKFCGTFIPDQIKLNSDITLKDNSVVKLVSVKKTGRVPNNKNKFIVQRKDGSVSEINGEDISFKHRESRNFPGLFNILGHKLTKKFLIELGLECGLITPSLNFDLVEPFKNISDKYTKYLITPLLNKNNIQEIINRPKNTYLNGFCVPRYTTDCLLFTSKGNLYIRYSNNTYLVEKSKDPDNTVCFGTLKYTEKNNKNLKEFSKPDFYQLSSDKIILTSKKINIVSKRKAFDPENFSNEEDIFFVINNRDFKNSSIYPMIYKWTLYDNTAVKCKKVSLISKKLKLDIKIVDSISSIEYDSIIVNPSEFKDIENLLVKIEKSLLPDNPIVSVSPCDSFIPDNYPSQNRVDAIIDYLSFSELTSIIYKI